MDTIHMAMMAVSECEARVRSLMEAALRERKYEELGELTEIARRLASVAKGESVQRGDSGADQAPEAMAELPSGPLGLPAEARHGRRLSGEQYPRFERRADRLVKLGWSKKGRTEYEHRAPMEVVHAVSQYLVTNAGEDGYIRMEDLLPITLDDGTEVPSYQAYLVLSWLRALSVVSRHGNDGYKVHEGKLDEEAFRELWENTPKS